RGFAIQRLMNAMRQAHADGWFIVFDTLTLADDRLEAFYDNPNALRDYFRDIGRMVLAAEAVQQECRDRKSGSAGMPRPISYAVFCLKKKTVITVGMNHSSARVRTTPCSEPTSRIKECTQACKRPPGNLRNDYSPATLELYTE